MPIRPLAYALVAIAVTCLFTFGLCYWLFRSYKGQQDAIEMSLKRTNVPAAKPAITGPKLQGVPGFSDKLSRVEMDDLRAKFQMELNSYGKAADGLAQIPVGRAMDLAIERGLFKTATTQPAGGVGATGNAPAPPPRSPPREGGVR